jgi:hypothetical protein
LCIDNNIKQNSQPAFPLTDLRSNFYPARFKCIQTGKQKLPFIRKSQVFFLNLERMPENGKILLPKTCSVNVRRFLIAFTLIVLSATSYNQPLPGNFFGLGVTSFGMDTQLSSSVGIHASLGYAKFYIDISNNLATSKAFGSNQ